MPAVPGHSPGPPLRAVPAPNAEFWLPKLPVVPVPPAPKRGFDTLLPPNGVLLALLDPKPPKAPPPVLLLPKRPVELLFEPKAEVLPPKPPVEVFVLPPKSPPVVVLLFAPNVEAGLLPNNPEEVLLDPKPVEKPC